MDIVDLGTIIDLPAPDGRGRPRSDSPVLHVVRALTEADRELIENPPKLGIAPTQLKRIGARHHQAARHVAEGKTDYQVAALTGYVLGTIRLYKQDPAFKELVEYYRSNLEATYWDVHKKLATLGEVATDELLERMEIEPERFSRKELREVAEFALDRSVAPTKAAGKMASGPTAPTHISISFVSSPNAGEPLLPPGEARVIEGRVLESVEGGGS